SSALDERCCRGDFRLCGKSRCEGHTHSLALRFIGSEEIGVIRQRPAHGESELVVPKLRTRAPKGIVIECTGDQLVVIKEFKPRPVQLWASALDRGQHRCP